MSATDLSCPVHLGQTKQCHEPEELLLLKQPIVNDVAHGLELGPVVGGPRRLVHLAAFLPPARLAALSRLPVDSQGRQIIILPARYDYNKIAPCGITEVFEIELI